MTVSYGDIIYNPTAAYVAALDSVANTYGTPAKVDYIGKLSYEYESDTDTIKSGGQIREMITIPTNAKGKFEEFSLNYIPWGILTGFGASEYSTTPNRYYRAMPRFGGSGLPYCGLIVAYAALNGANLLVGFAKFKLQNVPPFDVDQNKFRKGETEFMAIAAGDAGYGIVVQRYETAAQIPTTASTFLSFFTTPISVFQ